jgi:hypothetical protein
MGVGFRFHVFTLLSGKKKKHLSKPKNQLLQQKKTCPESLENFPSFSPHLVRDTGTRN